MEIMYVLYCTTFSKYFPDSLKASSKTPCKNDAEILKNFFLKSELVKKVTYPPKRTLDTNIAILTTSLKLSCRLSKFFSSMPEYEKQYE